ILLGPIHLRRRASWPTGFLAGHLALARPVSRPCSQPPNLAEVFYPYPNVASPWPARLVPLLYRPGRPGSRSDRLCAPRTKGDRCSFSRGSLLLPGRAPAGRVERRGHANRIGSWFALGTSAGTIEVYKKPLCEASGIMEFPQFIIYPQSRI